MNQTDEQGSERAETDSVRLGQALLEGETVHRHQNIDSRRRQSDLVEEPFVGKISGVRPARSVVIAQPVTDRLSFISIVPTLMA